MKARWWWRPQPAIDLVEHSGHHAEQRMGDVLLAESNGRVPYNTGELEASGEVTEDDGAIRVRYSAPHARFVHAKPERTFQHGRSGHWLEEAIEAAGDDMGQATVNTMRDDWPS